MTDKPMTAGQKAAATRLRNATIGTPAYVPPSREEEQAMMALDDTLNSIAGKYNLTFRWSVAGADDVYARHPHVGATTIRYRTSEHWGRKTDVVVTIHGWQWIDIWKAADEAIAKSGDRHHIFIENLTPGIGTELLLHTGS